MSCYGAYLEVGDDGRCLAHVLDLPGCVVRAPTRDAAMQQLPAAIQEYHDWLRRHGGPAPDPGEPIRVEVAAESAGYGPFDRGDVAALFLPDREPVTGEEMEWIFHLMAYSRADLMALTQHLPDDLLDWRPSAESFSIRGLLRHVGNAEEWYVSRLVPPDTLPGEWEEDETLPILEFLEMERRTAIARLRQLTLEERAGVFYPAVWTAHPEEPWTARKVLRRFLEHEREHTEQVREILAARRRRLLARLTTERAGLLEQILYLDESALTQVLVSGDWPVKEILAHIAAWDRWEERTMRSMVDGEAPDLTACHDLAASNAAFVAPWHDCSLGEVLSEFQVARASWVAWLAGLSEEAFFQPRAYAGDDWSFHTVPLRVQWERDGEHAAQIAAWRTATGLAGKVGTKAVLLAALDAVREELLAAAALVPVEGREARTVCGTWVLKDLLGHVADWEGFGAEGLRLMAAGRPPEVEAIEDVDAWNQAHTQARRGQSWEQVWDDLHAARRALCDALKEMDEAALACSFRFPWGPEGTPYQWAGVYFAHDREHARDLHTAVGVNQTSGV